MNNQILYKCKITGLNMRRPMAISPNGILYLMDTPYLLTRKTMNRVIVRCLKVGLIANKEVEITIVKHG